MNILVITKALDIGGAQKMISFMVNSISLDKNDVYLAIEENKILYHIPESVNKIIITIKDWKIFNRFRRLLLIVKIIHNHLKKKNIDIVVGFGPYYALIAFLSSRCLKTKVLAAERRSPSYLHGYLKVISKFVFPRCDMAVFQLEKARDFYNKIDINHTCIIPNPYITQTSIISVSAAKRKKIVVMAAARLEYEKGFDLGLKAFSIIKDKYPEYNLHIFGDGEIEDLYSKIINDNNLTNRVIFRGISKDIIAEIYDAKVFVLPSRSEGIPNILMEALGVGLPSVATDCEPGGPRLLIGSNNERGILVPKEDYLEIAKAIQIILDDNKYADELSQRAQSVREIFSSNLIKDKWIGCFEELMKND